MSKSLARLTAIASPAKTAALTASNMPGVSLFRVAVMVHPLLPLSSNSRKRLTVRDWRTTAAFQ